MESILWMLDVGAVAFLCLWALREDKKEEDARKDSAKNKGKRN